jgi:alkanesulfonate monooxygenase SsuD/methylene tetrahydromethanopterin reductase-like flavin-dependent oxidoreductase (luciferase family)
LGVLEPLTLLTALAGATDHIGLVATASTSYNSPYNLARKFASLDHVSGGRAGWNIVTTASPEAARNFGLDVQSSHAERYQRATEFIDVVRKLWDSWEDDAIVADKASGTMADAQAFYADLKGRTARLGCDPRTIKILPGIVPVIGGTEREALEKEAALEELFVHSYAQRELAQLLRAPVEHLQLDQQLPDQYLAAARRPSPDRREPVPVLEGSLI